MVLRFIRALPGDRPVTGLVCHRHRAKLASRNLASASGGQDHTISPSAEALANDTRRTRYRSPLFLAKAASRARQALCPRPSHPASDVRDDRETPSCGGGISATKSHISEKRKQNIFHARAGHWNHQKSSLNCFGKFDLSRTRFCAGLRPHERCSGGQMPGRANQRVARVSACDMPDRENIPGFRRAHLDHASNGCWVGRLTHQPSPWCRCRPGDN